ncbi:protocadherin-20 isoform X1 [Scophthalmus maximus]|uniref:protocadherin-20 isoform X1 n=1 Tax=Scophthalmus maximus TaxID=52904 RepID=UPI001FA8CBFF|nr:protocadherin-20 isoform X1 [Scophthalmus maximus]
MTCSSQIAIRHSTQQRSALLNTQNAWVTEAATLAAVSRKVLDYKTQTCSTADTPALATEEEYGQAKELIYKIKEGLPRGTFIGAIGVDLHLDFTVEPPFLFTLPQKKVSGQYVNLNNTTGELYTSATEIDRETLCADTSEGQGCVLSLDVFLLPQQYFQLIKVKILIEDVNDNRPKFPVDEICMSVPENAPVNARYAVEQSAVDPDLARHGVQTYWLVNDFGVFTLDVEENDGGELTPFLIVTEALDRETQAEYVTDIIAEDGGTPPLLGAATLKIVITDVNDNCPQFSESHINVTLHGNTSKGAHLARLHAFDPDLGANAQISYAYSERVPRDTRGLFHLDRITGVIKLAAKIDAVTSTFYKLTVLANGPGCIPAVATVTVHIIRVVTGPPAVIPRYIAPEKDGVVTLKESEPAFSPIAFFTVKNIDMNQRVDCHLEGAGPFRLGPYQQFKNEYLLETTEPLDYEKIQEYELIVVAKNTRGVVIKTLLKVQVLDENDNAPVFQQSLVEISVEENNPPNTFLTQLQASDQDSEGRGEVIYLLGGDSPGIFAVDRVTGVLTVTTSLDREDKETYRFIVRAVDQGTPRRESIATVVVTVQDRNDNSPRFINKDFTFFVPENFPGYGEIGVLSVTDADAGENGWVALSILNGTDIFMIDTGRGALRAKTSLDREQQGTYQLWIEAVDGGEPALSCVTMVTVLLLDVNDNPPIVLFPQSNQSYMLVLPNTLPGTSITEVYAVDKDTGMNAVIAYSIIKRKGGEPGSFAIDPETGNITLKRELSNRGLYSLLVKVSDHGQPEPLYSTVMVNFFVNETVSNESYIQSLLTREADIEIEERPWYIGQMTEGPERYELFPCQPVLIVLSVACLGLFFSVVTLTSYICCKRFKKHRKKRSEVEMPLKMKNDSMQVVNRKLRQISNI